VWGVPSSDVSPEIVGRRVFVLSWFCKGEWDVYGGYVCFIIQSMSQKGGHFFVNRLSFNSGGKEACYVTLA
jgi:hypothetical protein